MRCPVCRADNSEGPNCRRCKADLALLFALEKQREDALGLARHALAQDDSATGLRQAATAHALRRGPDSWQVLALAHLLRRNFAMALRCHAAAGG